VIAAGARVPAALVAAACGPGRPGLLHRRQGGLACDQEKMGPDGRLFRGPFLGNDGNWQLLLAF